MLQSFHRKCSHASRGCTGPKGSWCASGELTRCGKGTYNDREGKYKPQDCKSCPDNARTLDEGATSATECVCDASFVSFGEHGAADGAFECLCPAGLEVVSVGGAQSCLPCR